MFNTLSGKQVLDHDADSFCFIDITWLGKMSLEKFEEGTRKELIRTKQNCGDLGPNLKLS